MTAIAVPVREALPERRRSYTARVFVKPDDPHPVFIGVGFFEDGRPGEVFCDGLREGSDAANIARDACIVISISLQFGIRLETLGNSLARVPVWTADGMVEGPATVIGVIVAEALKAQAGQIFPLTDP